MLVHVWSVALPIKSIECGPTFNVLKFYSRFSGVCDNREVSKIQMIFYVYLLLCFVGRVKNVYIIKTIKV